MSVKSIIAARWVIPVQPRQQVLENHALVIENGRITDILPTKDIRSKYPDTPVTEHNTHALIPGFINAHTHAAMSLFRGMADDVPLMDWLNNHIWPAETKWVGQEFVRDGVELAIAEMLLGGTTCFNDMYFFPNIVAHIAQEMGIRAFVGLIVMDFPTSWADSPDAYFDKGLHVHDEVRSLSRIGTTLAPHAPYTVSDAPLEQVRTYADELNIPIQMHVHETRNEVSDAVAQNGARPLARLHALGLLNPRMMAVHMTQLTDDEIALCAEQGISIVHCPESNLKLASGQCRVADLLAAGANVCLGTDSAASNNDLDMLGEMQTAALLAKVTAQNAQALPAWQALEMATINGALALNCQDQVGSLCIGKSADFIAIDLDHISTQPVYDPVSQIVYSASREQITDVWVEGIQRVKHKQLVNIDIEHLLQTARMWGERLSTS
ncbi:N-ethylammeline chlorohydrolase [Arenicella chitinivorans]|uniref:N-ethylammeline chlorohydrolase n=1 Tax=Arenicella chitinivorans TaxID=1329800 RepID=A0A918RL65_9GAMM|nr:TRZ/ATZ family hydrolase [Arenicella chitinivorans]GGZ99219.1 N-ethylammeline chlorohydrolase [Arenicella chitinivorans]